ncbi:MAG: tetratricopeptide repeat protein [Myxococcota bacterium]|nr:tetratricopeptide repeat protein [Myxococcota bacterium]
MRPAALALGLLMCPFVALSASRVDQRQAAALVKKAGGLYEAGRYLDAAQTLEKAQAIDPHPRILYNIARAYDQAGELKQALEHYQRYIGSTGGTDPTLLKRSSLAVDRLRGLVAQQEEARLRAQAEQQRLEEEARASQLRAEAEAQAKRDAEQLADRGSRERLLAAQQGHDRAQLAAWITAGAGVVALGTGGFFGIQAYQTGLAEGGPFRQAEGVEGLTGKLHYADQAKQQALIADIAYGVGVVAAVSSVLLWPKSSRPQLANFMVGPTGAMVEVKF